MNFKRALKIAVAVFTVLCCSAVFAEEENENFGARMKAYSNTQKVAELFVSGKKMISEKGSWESEVEKLYDTAREKKINEKRVIALAKMSDTISTQYMNGHKQFDRFVEDILIAADFSEQQLVFAIATCRQLETFLKKTRRFDKEDYKDVKKDALEELIGFEKETILPKVKARFEDEELRGLVEDYVKLFPDAKGKLLFYNGAGSINKFDECCELFTKSMKAFRELDKCSALADFRTWGMHMLNYLLLDFEPSMAEEFKAQLDNYKNSFEVK